MKRKTLYVFMLVCSISLFSMAGQKKETCSKSLCNTKLAKSKLIASKVNTFDISPVGFLYVGIE